MSGIKDQIKRLDQLTESLKGIAKSSLAEVEVLSLIEDAQRALDLLDLPQLKQDLIARETDVRNSVNQQLSARRQELENRAREAGVAYSRLSNSDRVGMFRVDYSNRKVKLLLGSEELTTFEEINGARIMNRILEELRRLDAMLLPRDQFFRVLKTAFAMARSEGKVSDGKVKIRELFPYIAATRQLASDTFRKKPSAKSYVDYSLAMLAYEFSRFGDHEEGWKCGDERINNQGPAMSTQHEALILPGTTGNPPQVLWVWFA